MQTAQKILMVRPALFSFNEQTATNNHFQKKPVISNLNENAIKEFDDFVTTLRNNKVEVIVVQDTLEPHTPDSIYPNNWFSTHSTGEFVLYPMFAPNRRLERKPNVLATIQEHFTAKKVIDLTSWENKSKFLEGTGSMIFDYQNQLVYACRSIRTDDIVLKDFCTKMNSDAVVFDAFDEKGTAIYHTNVMLSIGEEYAVICSESITNNDQREEVINRLKLTKKFVVEITYDQMRKFCANIIEVKTTEGKNVLIMSESAKKGFTDSQITLLGNMSKIISSPLNSIEMVGGGSARCMIAEIF